MNTYKNGNYTVMIYGDGTKVRMTNDYDFIPAFSENCDVKITDKCGMGCSFCYEGCTKEGKHADLLKYTKLIDSLHPYTEMALNGNDLDIPNFVEFLELLKEKKVFANITVHQQQFMKNFDYIKSLQEKGLIHGIGVSLSNSSNEEFIQKLTQVKNTVIHTINGLFTETDYNNLKDKGLKVLFLGYKHLRRGDTYYSEHSNTIENNIKWLSGQIMDITTHFKVVSFDNLSLNQLDIKSKLDPKKWEEFYMGDDGGFTFYIDLVAGTFSKNSLSQVRYPIEDKTIDEMFRIIQENNK